MTGMPPTSPDDAAGGPADTRAARGLEVLATRGLTLATAESLTGGALGSALVTVPGASTVYVGGVITYATRLKVELLGVPVEVVSCDGVGLRCLRGRDGGGGADAPGADVGVSTTGVAGPDRQEGKPPGTSSSRWPTPRGPRSARSALDGDRAAVRAATVGGGAGSPCSTSASPPTRGWPRGVAWAPPDVLREVGVAATDRGERDMVLFRRLLGDVLRTRRIDQGRTLRQLCADARVSLGYMSEIERGQKEASSELLAAICSALDVPLSEILSDVADAVALEEAAMAVRLSRSSSAPSRSAAPSRRASGDVVASAA